MRKERREGRSNEEKRAKEEGGGKGGRVYPSINERNEKLGKKDKTESLKEASLTTRSCYLVVVILNKKAQSSYWPLGIS